MLHYSPLIQCPAAIASPVRRDGFTVASPLPHSIGHLDVSSKCVSMARHPPDGREAHSQPLRYPLRKSRQTFCLTTFLRVTQNPHF